MSHATRGQLLVEFVSVEIFCWLFLLLIVYSKIPSCLDFGVIGLLLITLFVSSMAVVPAALIVVVFVAFAASTFPVVLMEPESSSTKTRRPLLLALRTKPCLILSKLYSLTKVVTNKEAPPKTANNRTVDSIKLVRDELFEGEGGYLYSSKDSDEAFGVPVGVPVGVLRDL